MRIASFSDPHGYHRKLTIPECDVLICCGDISGIGELSILEDFANWVAVQPARHKIVIGGNHDMSLDASHPRYNATAESFFHRDASVSYLLDASITIDGLKFYGSPWVPNLPMWGFHMKGNPWKNIPNDTDVLITHGPPYNILDQCEVHLSTGWGVATNIRKYGCSVLAQRVTELKRLKLHCFGHIHDSGGSSVVIGNTTFVNAAVLDEGYNPDKIRQPVVVDI